MATFIAVLVLMGAAMVAMAIGVIISNRVLKGSCGGKGGEDCVCSIEEKRECDAKKKIALLAAAHRAKRDRERKSQSEAAHQ